MYKKPELSGTHIVEYNKDIPLEFECKKIPTKLQFLTVE